MVGLGWLCNHDFSNRSPSTMLLILLCMSCCSKFIFFMSHSFSVTSALKDLMVFTLWNSNSSSIALNSASPVASEYSSSRITFTMMLVIDVMRSMDVLETILLSSPRLTRWNIFNAKSLCVAKRWLYNRRNLSLNEESQSQSKI